MRLKLHVHFSMQNGSDTLQFNGQQWDLGVMISKLPKEDKEDFVDEGRILT